MGKIKTCFTPLVYTIQRASEMNHQIYSNQLNSTLLVVNNHSAFSSKNTIKTQLYFLVIIELELVDGAKTN